MDPYSIDARSIYRIGKKKPMVKIERINQWLGWKEDGGMDHGFPSRVEDAR